MRFYNHNSGDKINEYETGGAGYVELMGDKRQAYRILERKPLGRRTISWKENVITDIKKQDGRSLDGWTWVRMGPHGGLL